MSLTQGLKPLVGAILCLNNGDYHDRIHSRLDHASRRWLRCCPLCYHQGQQGCEASIRGWSSPKELNGTAITLRGGGHVSLWRWCVVERGRWCVLHFRWCEHIGQIYRREESHRVLAGGSALLYTSHQTYSLIHYHSIPKHHLKTNAQSS